MPSITVHLLEDEKILANCVDRGVTFYVTNKRLLKHQKSGRYFFGKESLQDISFKEITSISLETSRSGLKIITLGIIFLLGGVIWHRYSPWSFILGILGILTVLIGIVRAAETGWFQLKGPGLLRNDEESQIWRITQVKSPDVRNFVRVVREQIDVRDKAEKIRHRTYASINLRTREREEALKPTPKVSPEGTTSGIDTGLKLKPVVENEIELKSSSEPSFDPQAPPQARGNLEKTDGWMDSLYYNKGFEDSKTHNNKSLEDINEYIMVIESGNFLMDFIGDEFIDNQVYKHGYLEGLKKLRYEKSKLYYSEGFTDSKNHSNKTTEEISGLIKKIEESDPSILDLLPRRFIDDEYYRRGYIAGLKSLIG